MKNKSKIVIKLKQDLINNWFIAAFFVFSISLCLIFVLPDRKVHRITFLDVGQGDCILVQLKSGENYLFDCGSVTRKRVGERVLIPCLKYYGITCLDGVFVSHVDTDHMNGILELMTCAGDEHIRVKQLFFSEESVKDAFLSELLFVPVETEIRKIQAGMRWEVKDVEFVCINPPEEVLTVEDGPPWESNEASLGFLIRFPNEKREVCVILAGDVEGKGEIAMTKQLKKEMDESSPFVVLKVAHHGSKYSTYESLLECISPGLAIISCGKNNSYGHPHGETIERLKNCGCRIVRTDQAGAVTLSISSKQLKVRTSITEQTR